MAWINETPYSSDRSTALGEATGWSDVFSATLAATPLTDNSNARAVAMERAADAIIDRLDQAGIRNHGLVNPMRVRRPMPQPDAFGVERSEDDDPVVLFERRRTELAGKHPDHRDLFKVDRSLTELAREQARDADERSQNVLQRYGGWAPAWSASLPAGMVGSFYDPINIAALAAGPYGRVGQGARAVLWQGVKTGAVNAAAETAIQPFVQNWRKEAGLEYGLSPAAMNVMAAFGFGGALDVGIRGGFRAIAPRVGGLVPRLDAQGEVEGWMRPRPAAETWQSRHGDIFDPDVDTAGEVVSYRARLPGQPAAVRKPPSAAQTDGTGARLPGSVASEPPESRAPAAAATSVEPQGARLPEPDALARETGVVDDPSLRGARQTAETQSRIPDDPSPFMDDADRAERLVQALRNATDDAEPPPRSPDPVMPARQGYEGLGDDAPAPPSHYSLDKKPVSFKPVPARAVATDAGVFQFKGNTNADGVALREGLLGVTQWDPLAAGRVFVFERRDGSLIIADGHQRLALAKRLEATGHPPIDLNASVFREADGWTPADVRALAAKKNLQEGRTDLIDAATILRERPDVLDGSVPLTGYGLRQARALSRLSNEAWAKVVSGEVAPNHAALVADLVEARALHGGVLDAISKADPRNAREVRNIINDLLHGPREEVQDILLGGDPGRAFMAERASVLDAANKLLKDDANIFALLSREAQRIMDIGNVLKLDANADRVLQSETVQAIIETLASRPGRVRDWLTEAAREAAEQGGKKAAVKRAAERFATRVREAIEAEGIAGLRPAELPPLNGGRGVDAPGGAEARAQVAELEAELQAAMSKRLREVAEKNLERWADWQRLNKRPVPTLDPVERAEVIRLIAETGEDVPGAIAAAHEAVAAERAERVATRAEAAMTREADVAKDAEANLAAYHADLEDFYRAEGLGWDLSDQDVMALARLMAEGRTAEQALAVFEPQRDLADIPKVVPGEPLSPEAVDRLLAAWSFVQLSRQLLGAGEEAKLPAELASVERELVKFGVGKAQSADEARAILEQREARGAGAGDRPAEAEGAAGDRDGPAGPGRDDPLTPPLGTDAALAKLRQDLRRMLGDPDDDSRAALGGDPDSLASREAAARVVMDSEAWRRAAEPPTDRSRITSEQPGYGSPEWRAGRVYSDPETGAEIRGWDAAVAHLVRRASDLDNLDTARTATADASAPPLRDISFDINTNGSQTNVVILKDGDQIGRAYVRHLQDDDAIQLGNISVVERYQRQGIMTTLQRHLEERFAVPVVPDVTLSQLEYGRWLKMDPDAVAGYAKRGGENFYAPVAVNYASMRPTRRAELKQQAAGRGGVRPVKSGTRAMSEFTESSVEQGKKAVILIGYPGAGKSTIARQLSQTLRAAHITADNAKKLIPEYDNGANTYGVHTESAHLAAEASYALVKDGRNIIVETLGSQQGHIDGRAAILRDAGYDVSLVHVDVPKAVAMERAVNRFQADGQAMPAEIYDTLDAGGVYAKAKETRSVDQAASIAWDEAAQGWRLAEADVGADGSADVRAALATAADRASAGQAAGYGGRNPAGADAGLGGPGGIRGLPESLQASVGRQLADARRAQYAAHEDDMHQKVREEGMMGLPFQVPAETVTAGIRALTPYRELASQVLPDYVVGVVQRVEPRKGGINPWTRVHIQGLDGKAHWIEGNLEEFLGFGAQMFGPDAFKFPAVGIPENKGLLLFYRFGGHFGGLERGPLGVEGGPMAVGRAARDDAAVGQGAGQGVDQPAVGQLPDDIAARGLNQGAAVGELLDDAALPAGFWGHFERSVRGDFWHETIHAIYMSGRIRPAVWNRLVAHANRLQIMDITSAEFRRLTEVPGTQPDNRSLGHNYRRSIEDQFALRSDIPDKEGVIKAVLDEEAVAHMVQLVYHGALPEAAVRPIRRELEAIFGGRSGDLDRTLLSAGNDNLNSRRAQQPMFALGGDEIPAGIVQRRALDSLGFYSQALEAAKALRQAKGTPEQMRAMLRSAGVKEAELQAAGFDQFLQGKKSVTRDEIVSFLEQNRVEVREEVYGVLEKPASRNSFDVFHDAGFAGHAKWTQYSIDPSNPTYRETVMHLPEAMPKDEVERRAAEISAQLRDSLHNGTLTQEQQQVLIDERSGLWERHGMMRQSDLPANFHSGHFSEPNVIAHARTSLHKDSDGKIVFLIDELQSDWGQKLREGGVRDEAKIAELRKRVELLRDAINPDNFNSLQGAERQAWHILRRMNGNFDRAIREAGAAMNADEVQRVLRDWEFKEPRDGMSKAMQDFGLAEAELRTAEASTPGHPLVNTTDQWVTTALRRLVAQAVAAGAEKIAITPGKVQAERFDLFSHVDEINVSKVRADGRRTVYLVFPSDSRAGREAELVVDSSGVVVEAYHGGMEGATGRALREVIGQERAAQVLASPDEGSFASDGVMIGGEGMRATYDGIYPRALQKILQRFDPGMKGPSNEGLFSPMDGRAFTSDRTEVRAQGWGDVDGATDAVMREAKSGTPAIAFHTFPLTEKVKARIKNEGQPLFALGGDWKMDIRSGDHFKQVFRLIARHEVDPETGKFTKGAAKRISDTLQDRFNIKMSAGQAAAELKRTDPASLFQRGKELPLVPGLMLHHGKPAGGLMYFPGPEVGRSLKTAGFHGVEGRADEGALHYLPYYSKPNPDRLWNGWRVLTTRISPEQLREYLGPNLADQLLATPLAKSPISAAARSHHLTGLKKFNLGEYFDNQKLREQEQAARTAEQAKADAEWNAADPARRQPRNALTRTDLEGLIAADAFGKQLKSGRLATVEPHGVEAGHDTLRPHLDLMRDLPEGHAVGFLEKVQSLFPGSSDFVAATFRTHDGRTVVKYGSWDNDFSKMRATYDPADKAFLFLRFAAELDGATPREGASRLVGLQRDAEIGGLFSHNLVGDAGPSGQFAESLIGEFLHELYHARRMAGLVDDATHAVLVSHGQKLRVLDSDLDTYLEKVRRTDSGRATDRTSTLRDRYIRHYITRPNKNELVAEEYATHLLELAWHGQVKGEDLAPVRMALERVFGAGDERMARRLAAMDEAPRFALAGPKAQTADLAKLQIAQDMERRGRSGVEIVEATRWFRDINGGWMFRIPDSDIALTPRAEATAKGQGRGRFTRPGPLSGLVTAPEHFAAYPQLKDTQGVLQHRKTTSDRPGIAAVDQLRGDIGVVAGSARQARGGFIQAVQGAIDRIEGRPMGTEPEAFGVLAKARTDVEAEAKAVLEQLAAMDDPRWQLGGDAAAPLDRAELVAHLRQLREISADLDDLDWMAAWRRVARRDDDGRLAIGGDESDAPARRTLSIPGLKPPGSARLVTGLFPAAPDLAWTGLPNTSFRANVAHLALKRMAKDDVRTQGDLSTPEKMEAHIREVLAAPTLSLIDEHREGGAVVNLVRLGANYDQMVAIALTKTDRGQLYIPTAYNLTRETTRRRLYANVHNNGIASVRWQKTADSEREILHLLEQAPAHEQRSSWRQLRTTLVESQRARDQSFAAIGGDDHDPDLPGSIWDEAQDDRWEGMARRSTAGEISHAYAPEDSIKAPRKLSVLAAEQMQRLMASNAGVEKLRQRVADFERSRWEEGLDANGIAGALRAEFPHLAASFDPVGIAKRQVWWRMDEIIRQERRRPHFPPERDLELKELVEAGASLREIGREMGLSHTSIREHMERLGLRPKRANVDTWPSERYDELRRLFDAGKQDKEIARAMGITPRLVSYRLGKLGLLRFERWKSEHQAEFLRLDATGMSEPKMAEAMTAFIGRPISAHMIHGMRQRAIEAGTIAKRRAAVGGAWTPERIAELTSSDIAMLSGSEAAAVLSARPAFEGMPLTRNAIIAQRRRLGVGTRRAANEQMQLDLAQAEALGIPVDRMLEDSLGETAPILEAAQRAKADLVEGWKHVRAARRVQRPERLVSFLVRTGGLKDDGGDLLNMLGSTKQRPGLIAKGGANLDDAALRAWEAGYLTGEVRPTINQLLAAIDDDLRGKPVFKGADADAAADLADIAQMEMQLDRYGIAGAKSETEAAQRLDAYLSDATARARAQADERPGPAAAEAIGQGSQAGDGEAGRGAGGTAADLQGRALGDNSRAALGGDPIAAEMDLAARAGDITEMLKVCKN